MIYVAYLCLFVIIVACLAGLAWGGYKENLFQNWGLTLLGIASGLRLDQLFERHSLSWVGALFYFSLALYMVGTAYKAWQAHKERPQ